MSQPTTTRRSMLLLAAGAGLGALAAPYVITPSRIRAEPAAGADGYIPLFDGKTLNGWHKNPQKIGHGTGGKWEVKDGAIVGEQDPPNSGNGGILLTDRKFSDFELLLEMNPDWGIDSGLFLRSNDKGQCVQMMVDYHEAGNVGHLYGEGTGGWNTRPFTISGEIGYGGNLVALFAEPDKNFKPESVVSTCTGEEFARAWKIDEWNVAKVRCVGKYPKITTWINDLKVCEWDGETCRHPQYDREKLLQTIGTEGSIAVQVHGGKGAWAPGAKCRWRNIRIKPL
jgi:3-keto-disaccharide hydrolase